LVINCGFRYAVEYLRALGFVHHPQKSNADGVEDSEDEVDGRQFGLLVFPP
jgi:hypothetical protein